MPATKRPLAVLFLTVFLDLLGFGLIIPLLPFFAQHTGATPFMVTVLMASYSLMQFLVTPLWGRLSDRIGRRPVLLMSIGGSVVALLFFALSTSYVALLFSRMLHGAMNANIAVAQAYVADVTTAQTRAKGMGVFGAAFGLGFIFGPFVGGVLGAVWLPLPAFAAAGLAALNLALALVLLPETRVVGAPAPRAWRLLDVDVLRGTAGRARLRTFLAVGLLVTLGFSAMESTFVLWSERAFGWHTLQNGWFFAYVGLVIVIVQGGLIGPLRRRFGEARLATGGLGLLAVSLALLPSASSLGPLLVIAGGLALGNGLLQPSLSSLVSFEAVEGRSGATLGLYQSLGSLGRVLGPLLAGATFDWIGISVPFRLGGILALVALALMLWLPSALVVRECESAGSISEGL